MNLTRQDCKTSRADSLTPRVQSKTPGVEGKYPRKDSLTRKIDNKTPRKVLKTEVNCKTDKLSIRFSSNSGSSLNQDLTKSTIKEESNRSKSLNVSSLALSPPHIISLNPIATAFTPKVRSNKKGFFEAYFDMPKKY